MSLEVNRLEELSNRDFEVINRLINMPTIVFNHHRAIFVNDAFETMMGYDVEIINDLGLEGVVVEQYVKRFYAFLERATTGVNFSEQGELCLRSKEGMPFWVEYKSRLVSYEGEVYLLAHLMEINEKKKTQENLSKLVRLRESMLEVTQSIVQSADIAELYDLILVNAIKSIPHAKLGTILLLDGDQLRPVAQCGFDPASITEFTLPIESLFLYKAIGPSLDRTAKIDDLIEFCDYYKIQTLEGEAFIRSTISAPIFVKGKFFGCVNIDATEVHAFDEDDVKMMSFIRNNVEIAISNKLLYEEKAYLSKYDSLTQLYNRHYFEEMFMLIKERAYRYNERFNLVVFDLNGLKVTNDEHGHIAGDEVLKFFSKSCKSLIRKSDVLARYGGDEFVGLFFNCNIDKLRRRIDGHLKYLDENPIRFHDEAFKCSYSYGISAFGQDGHTLEELFKVADDRMYQNKLRFKLGFDFIHTFEESI